MYETEVHANDRGPRMYFGRIYRWVIGKTGYKLELFEVTDADREELGSAIDDLVKAANKK